MTLPVLYPILDTALLESRGCPVEVAADAMLDAGVQILQWRCKGAVTRNRLAEAEAVLRRCRRHGAQFVVNDRTDIAVMVGSGLHLGQEDMPVEIAREMVGQHTLLGLSTHNREQLDAGTHTRADYLAFGPVFATANKSNPDPVVGLARLREARALADRPLVAIGGITRDNALSALEAGADSLAVIGDLFPAECTRDTIRQRVQEWFEVLHG